MRIGVTNIQQTIIELNLIHRYKYDQTNAHRHDTSIIRMRSTFADVL